MQTTHPKRFTRRLSDPLPPIRLDQHGFPTLERQKQIIRTVKEHERIRAGDLKYLIDGETRGNLLHAARLYRHRFLNVKNIGNNEPNVYVLDNRGEAFLATEQHRSKRTIDFAAKNRKVKPKHAAHQTSINKLKIGIERTLTDIPPASLAFWYNDGEIEIPIEYTAGGRRIKRKLKPDSLFAVRYFDLLFGGILEMDKATIAGITKTEDRLYDRYEAYAELGYQFRKKRILTEYGLHSLRVFTITTSDERAENFRSLARRACRNKRAGGHFWFTHEKIYRKNHDMILRPIWKTLKDNSYHPLFTSSKALQHAQHRALSQALQPLFPLTFSPARTLTT